MEVSIIGAGIGGLTLALALQKKNIPYQIFESALEIKPIGAGITLANNATQIFKRLEIYDQTENAGHHVTAFALTDKHLKPLATSNLRTFEKMYGVKNIAIKRGALQEVLLDQLSPENIHLNKQLTKIEEKASNLQVHFADNSHEEVQFLIGADGIHSAVRNCWLPPSEVRRPKQVCWRGMTSFILEREDNHMLKEAWGLGTRFGFVQVDEKTVYWYALANYRSDFEKEYAQVDLVELFKGYHPLVKSLLSSTPKMDIIFNEILDLKPLGSWHGGNVCLMGDAAHATTPNMGQGAGQAVEDAFVLAQCLHNSTTTTEAFVKFESIRRKKALDIVNASWQLGKMAQLSNPLLAGLRNLAMRLVPDSLGQKRNRKIFDLNY